MIQALIFDCDGVIVDTERDGHRVAFNQAFRKMGLDIEWDVALYGKLLQIAGGKERMKYYFNQNGWPEQFDNQEAAIKELHKLKTDLFMEIIKSGELPLRSGVRRLVDEAIDKQIKLAVCSTSNERAVNLIVEKLLGEERKSHFDRILAGDVVTKKKPDPEIYNLAKQELNLNAEACVVIEDSRNGLLAAKSAGMHCIVTTNGYTASEDFREADRVVTELGDPPQVQIDLKIIQETI
jgi:HAD superfamily hydrolase (TIGR01509 family)